MPTSLFCPFLQVLSETVSTRRKLATAPAACTWSDQTKQKGQCRLGVNRTSTTAAGPLSRAGETAPLTSSGTGIATRCWHMTLPPPCLSYFSVFSPEPTSIFGSSKDNMGAVTVYDPCSGTIWGLDYFLGQIPCVFTNCKIERPVSSSIRGGLSGLRFPLWNMRWPTRKVFSVAQTAEVSF